MPFYPPVPGMLGAIEHFVVLMLENRSFDHLLGFEARNNPDLEGVLNAPGNNQSPGDANSQHAGVSRATAYAMPFDPGHEFDDVAIQLYAPGNAANPITMGGFLFSAFQTAAGFADAARVMEGFQDDQLPVLTRLAREFAVFNYWFSSLPGPTWPNRFFVHAATSGGLCDSPSTAQIIAGFKFQNGTIYERLMAARRRWRVYHDGLPQLAGIDSIRPFYTTLFATEFREIDKFASDVADDDLPEYTFIEPRYDTGNQYVRGNSMHPMNDLRQGEGLLKLVYETIRNSATLWPKTMLIVTFDEHGGFYDHVPPPAVTPTGDDARYNRPGAPFGFDRLGIRVPSLVISAYTQPGSVIGMPGSAPFDHASILRTVEGRFGLPPLTQRDANAVPLDVALNLGQPRNDAPPVLPDPLTDDQAVAIGTLPTAPVIPPTAQLSDNQQSLVDLALKCNLDMANPAMHDALLAEHASVRTQGDAADYLDRHDAVIKAHRE